MPTCAPSPSRFRVTETVCLLEDWTKIRGKRGSQNLWQDETGRQVYSRTEPGRRGAGDAGGVVDAQQPLGAGPTPGRKPSAVETPEFRRWFGDSKVVDGSGKPLVVYHGTRREFHAFDPAKLGSASGHPLSIFGTFFTASPQVADLFSKDIPDVPFPDVPAAPHSEGAATMPVYLAIRNPKVISAEEFRNALPVHQSYNQEASDETGNAFVKTEKQLRAIRDAWMKEGYDGLLITKDPRARPGMGMDEWLADQWVAFEPEQIKSAIGNRGTFDPRSPKINESRTVREEVAFEGWVTLNAGSGEDGDGGVRVFIDDKTGKVEKGPRGVRGRSMPEAKGKSKPVARLPERSPKAAPASSAGSDNPKIKSLRADANRLEGLVKKGGAPKELMAVWQLNAKHQREEADRLERGDTSGPPRRADPVVVAKGHRFAGQIAPQSNALDTPEKSAAWHNREFGAFVDALNDRELDAVASYTGGDFTDINDGLRGLQKLDAERSQTVQVLDSVLEKSSLSAPAIVYRGIADVSVLGDLDQLVGKVISDKAYTSTSSLVDVANGFANDPKTVNARFDISLPKGAKAVSADAALGPGSLHQHEVVLPRGAALRITGIQRRDLKDTDGRKVKDFYVIQAELVPSGSKPATRINESVTFEGFVVNVHSTLRRETPRSREPSRQVTLFEACGWDGAALLESDSDWDPNEHPREDDGQFANKGEGGIGGGTVDKGEGERKASYRDMRRSRKTPVVEFPKPIVGPSGAKLTSYEWKYTTYQDVDARGEEKIRRVSDWEEAVGSDDTGRDIVHHFHITDKDGRAQVVSLESALKELGYLKRDAKSLGVTNIKTLASALKRRALAQVTVDQREDLQERFDAAMKDVRGRVEKMSPPEITEDADGDGQLRKFRLGDAQQWKHGGQDLTPEDRKSLEREWRRNRLVELFPLELAQEAAGLAGRSATEASARSMLRNNTELTSFKQETDQMKKKIGDLDRQITILADEAVETAAGGVSGPEKHRGALRQLDELWDSLLIGADGRECSDHVEAAKSHIKAHGTENWNDRGRENGSYEMELIVKDLRSLTGRDWAGRKTGKALLADETPEAERFGKKVPAVPASPDKKVTKWYMDNKEAIEDVLQRIEKWKKQYRPDRAAESQVREGWITLNAKSGDDEQGGVRVYIEDGSGKVAAGPEGLMGKSFPEARGKSRPVAQLREPGDTKAGPKPDDTKVETPTQPPSAIGRSPNMPILRFPKPIVGPSGARLESYEWKYTTQEDEEAGKRRVSDWSQAVGSDRTGRDIVHQFHVVDQDGNRKVVSLDSALKELGYVPADAKTAPVKGIKDLGTALKQRGLAQLELDRREDLQRRFDATLEKIHREVAALPVPAAEKIEDQDDYSRHRIGDVEQRQAQTGGLNDDVRQELEQEWRNRRTAERFPLDLGREAAEASGLPGNDTEARAMATRGLRYFKQDTDKKRQQLRRLDQKIEGLAGQASRMAESVLCRQVQLFEAWSQHEGPRGGTYWLKDGDRESKTYRKPSESGRSDGSSGSRLDTTSVERPTSYPVEARGQQYVVRPEAQQRDPHGRLSGDFTQRELAAHVLDRELGGRLVPRTEYVTAEGGKGARQPLVAGDSPAALTALPEGAQQAVAAFDFIIGAANRRPDQVKVDAEGRPQLVSNGRAFYSNGDLAEIGFGDPAQRPSELGGEGLAVAELVLSSEDRLRPQLMLMLPSQQVDDVFTRAKMLIRNQRNLRELFRAEGFAAALEVQQVGFPAVSPTPLGDDPETWGETPPASDVPEAMHDRAFVGADRYEEYAIRFNQALRRELGQETPLPGTTGAEHVMTPHWPAKIRRDVVSRIQDADGALDRRADQLLGAMGPRAEGLEGKTALEKVTGAVVSAMNEPAQANRDLAQAIQYAAAERFGGQVPAWADRSLYDQQPELFHAIAQGIYDNTQNRLRAAGIPGLVVYRGVDLTPQPEEFRRLWDTAATGRGAVRAVDGVQVNQQPVASWTQNPYLAHNAAVGYGSNRQMVLGAWVPAEKIFSLPFSGPGDASSQEVLTLGEYHPEQTRAVLFNDWRYSLEEKHMMGPLSAVGSHSHEWFWGENPALTENPRDTTAPHEQRKAEEGTFMYAAGDEPEPGLKVLRPHSVEQDGDQRVESYLAMDQRGGSEARTILLQVRAKPYRAAEAWTPYQGPKGGKGWQDTSTGRVEYGTEQPGRGHGTGDGQAADLRGDRPTGGSDGRLRATAGRLGDTQLSGAVSGAGTAGAADSELRGLDGAAMKLAGVKLQDRDRESLAQQGLYLHGTSADFTHFKPGGHGAIYLSSADSHGRVTQAEHIASGPFGGRLVAVKVDQSKLKKFDPMNDPESKRVWQAVFGDKPVRDYVDYPDMHLVVREAGPLGYNAFRVYEPSVQGMSLAVTDPTALRIVGDSRLPSKEPNLGTATRTSDDKAGAVWKSDVKALLPEVKAPLFHATTGPRAAQIFQEGVKAGGYSDFGQGNVGSVSLTENLDWATEGHRGNYILVFDRDDLAKQGELVPFQAPGVPNEFEQRFLKDAIPPSSIKGMVVNGHLATFMQKEAETWGFPVVYKDKHKGWTRIGGGVTATESCRSQGRRPVVREILLDRDPAIAGWLHRYRVFQASEGWVEYKGPRGGTYWLKDGDRATKTYRKPQDMETPEAKPAAPVADAGKPDIGGGAPPESTESRPSKTDTPEFKNWFGDSKVVDREGKPLVVYHAAKVEFVEFDPEKIGTSTDEGQLGRGFYFSTDQNIVDAEDGETLMQVFLKAENPFEISMKTFTTNKERLIRDALGLVESATAVDVTKVLKDRGHDSVRLDYSPVGYKHQEIVVFDPTQVKSATGNRGTYDPKSPKINESVPLETHPLLHEGWIEYDGPLGGEGWKNTETGKVAYVDEMPGRREGSAEPRGSTSLKPHVADTAQAPADKPQAPEAPKPTPIRFKVRGSGEWEWDGEAPVVKGPLGGMPHYRVTRLEDGRQGTLTSYGREGWRIDLDGDTSYRAAAHGGGRNPIEAKQKAEHHTETRTREGDREAGEAGRKAALQMMDTALSDMRPLRQQAEAMSNDIAPRRAETTRIARESWSKVVNRFGPKALEAIGQVKKIAVYEEQAELAKSLVRWDNPEEKVRGIQGAYRHDDKTGELLLSGAGVVDPEGVYAHELTHAVDGPQSVYSSARKWRNAWKAEIGSQEENRVRRVMLPSGEIKELVGKAAEEVQVGDRVLLGDGVAKAVLEAKIYTKGRFGKVFEVLLEGEVEPHLWKPDAAYVMADSPEAEPAPLTRYAQTSASEGLAEFGRLLVADPARAKKEFPKCWKCWREWHLVEEPTARESATTGRLRERVAFECLVPDFQLNKE